MLQFAIQISEPIAIEQNLLRQIVNVMSPCLVSSDGENEYRSYGGRPAAPLPAAD